MKHHILVSVQKPVSDEYKDEQAWYGFLSAISSIENKAIQGERLSENVWLLDRDSDPTFLAHVVLSASRQRLEYSVRYLSSDS
jgi:hypothetical protein